MVLKQAWLQPHNKTRRSERVKTGHITYLFIKDYYRQDWQTKNSVDFAKANFFNYIDKLPLAQWYKVHYYLKTIQILYDMMHRINGLCHFNFI